MAEVAELIRRLRNKLESEHGPLSALYEKQVRGQRLLWPPVAASKVARAQKKLGFSLPPLLAAVYQEIGNGGLALKLIGLPGGQTGFLAGPDCDVGYGGKDNVRGYLDTLKFGELLLEEEWPAGLIPIYDGLGCGMVDHCDCTTPEGRVWRWDSPGSAPWIERGLSVEYPSLAAYWDIASD
jgi:hypothetical protein